MFGIHFREGRSSRRILLNNVCCIVINKFFVSFEVIGGSYNPPQNAFRSTKEFEKCSIFMESLNAGFIQFSIA